MSSHICDFISIPIGRARGQLTNNSRSLCIVFKQPACYLNFPTEGYPKYIFEADLKFEKGTIFVDKGIIICIICSVKTFCARVWLSCLCAHYKSSRGSSGFVIDRLGN